MTKNYLNTVTGELYTHDEVYDYLFELCLDDEERDEITTYGTTDKDISLLLEIIDESLENLNFAHLYFKDAEKINSSTTDDCRCKKKSTDSSILDSPMFNSPMPMGVFDDSYSNTTTSKETRKKMTH